MSTTQLDDPTTTGPTDPHAGARTGTYMALGSMLAVQLGIAAAVGLFDEVGPLGAAWLRLAWAGLSPMLPPWRRSGGTGLLGPGPARSGERAVSEAHPRRGICALSRRHHPGCRPHIWIGAQRWL